jgi:hypothetical protein
MNLMMRPYVVIANADDAEVSLYRHPYNFKINPKQDQTFLSILVVFSTEIANIPNESEQRKEL